MMSHIVHVKRAVRKMERTQDWMAICRYLLTEWKEHQDSPELCVLLMQQAMSYLLASDNGNSPHSCHHNNPDNENLRFYRDCFVGAASHGMNHHLDNKYFLWQVCYYLFYFPTYYPVLLVVEYDKLETKKNELLALAKTQFTESNLFLPWLSGVDYYEWLHNMGSDKLVRVHAEIQEFHLGKNAVDEDVKDLFFWSFDSAAKKGI